MHYGDWGRDWTQSKSFIIVSKNKHTTLDPSLLALVSFKLVVYPSPVSTLQKRKYLKRGITCHCLLYHSLSTRLISRVSSSRPQHEPPGWKPAYRWHFCLCWQWALFSLVLHPFHPPACSATSKYLISCSANFWSRVCSHLGKCTWIMEAAWSEAGVWLLLVLCWGLIRPSAAAKEPERADETTSDSINFITHRLPSCNRQKY